VVCVWVNISSQGWFAAWTCIWLIQLSKFPLEKSVWVKDEINPR
jgi:hypothetical protein